MLETMGMAITSNSESFIEKAFEFIWEQMQAVKVEDMGVPELGWLDNEDGMLKRVPVDQVAWVRIRCARWSVSQLGAEQAFGEGAHDARPRGMRSPRQRES